MHVSGHNHHIAHPSLWNTKQLPAFSEEEKQRSVSIPVHILLFHLAADFGKRKKQNWPDVFPLKTNPHPS